MKKYSGLLLVPAIVGILSVVYPSIFRRTDIIAAELGPLLSPGASIVLPTSNATLFSDLTRRFIELMHPDITAVVRVGAEADVPLIIKYAGKKGRPILAANRRHGWSTSLNSVHNAILIDISTLTAINIDAAANTATVGGGVDSGGMLGTLRAAGKQTTVGVCDCVGLLGASLGGGHGRLQGLHGLMTDNIVSVQLATASGEMIIVSNTSNADLFWGLRGAGHNFGIITSAVYRIHDLINDGFQFNAEIIYAPDQIEALFIAIEGFTQTAKTSIFVVFVPGLDQIPIVSLSFSSYAPAEEALSQLESGFGHLPHLTRTDSIVPSDQMNTVGSLGIGHVACQSSDRKNTYGASLKRYDPPTIRAVYNSFAQFLKANPEATGSGILWETYPLHAVQAVPEAETAYAHRDERHIVMLLAGYPNSTLDSAANAWLGTATAALHSTGGFEKPAVYMNYAQGTEGLGALYGYEEWRLERLKALKKKYDPEGVFSGYHAIPRE